MLYSPAIQQEEERRHGPQHAQTGQSGARSVGDRPRLHGHEPVLRAGRRRRVGGDAASGDRARLHLLRHGRDLWAIQERGPARAGAGGPAGRGHAGHQVRLPLRSGCGGRSAARQPAGDHPKRRRGVAEAAADRPYRPSLPAQDRSGGADRGGGRDGRRPGAAGQGALLRPLGGGRGQHPQGPCDASGFGAAERIFAVGAQPGSRGDPGAQGARHRPGAVRAAGPRLPHGRREAGRGVSGRRLPARRSALPGRALRRQHGGGKDGDGHRGGAEWDAGAGGACLAARQGRRHRADPRHQASALFGGEPRRPRHFPSARPTCRRSMRRCRPTRSAERATRPP